MKVAHACSLVAGAVVLASTVAYPGGTFQFDESDNNDIIVTKNENRTLRHRHRSMTEPCLVVSANKHFENGLEEEDLCYCELKGDDRDGKGYTMVKIVGIPDGWCKDNIDSAGTQLFARSTDINYNSNELLVESSDEDVVYTKYSPSKKLILTGNNVFSVLVLRGNGLDQSVEATSAALSDAIFGTNGDNLNLRTQYRACSYNQMTFNPVILQGSNTTDGVYDVSVPYNISGTPDDVIRNAMVGGAIENFGTDLTNVADFVMVCIPPGTIGGWIAYAYSGYYLSVYNDRWCTFPSTQIHELGHNLKLSHSGERGNKYGDRSGMMGYSYFSENGPRMCFNGAKTFQLGWFKNYHQEFSSNAGFFSWTGYMVGFVHRELATEEEKMILRISDNSSNINYFVHFNRKSGFNSGTREAEDMVMVASAHWDREKSKFDRSSLLAKLDAGASFRILDFGGMSGASLTIFVPWILLEPMNKARVEITFAGPLTAAPSLSPTRNPSLSTLPSMPYPSTSPTTDLYPSALPTNPNLSTLPTIPYPSLLPSPLPTTDLYPSTLPTTLPTISASPTIPLPSALPTNPSLSTMPSILYPSSLPSSLPTPLPTTNQYPSLLPTSDLYPSTPPTIPYPSPLPTTSLYPSTLPSILYRSPLPTSDLYPSTPPTVPYQPIVAYPSTLPTGMPSASFQPSGFCKDNELFLFRARIDRQRTWRSCSWVSSESKLTTIFCTLTDVKNNCKLTCNNCDPGYQES